MFGVDLIGTQAPKPSKEHAINIWQHPAAAPGPKLQSAHRHLFLYFNTNPKSVGYLGKHTRNK